MSAFQSPIFFLWVFLWQKNGHKQCSFKVGRGTGGRWREAREEKEFSIKKNRKVPFSGKSTLAHCFSLSLPFLAFIILLHFPIKSRKTGTSLVAQWLRIRLPMQGTRVWALVREDPTCHGATKPVHHNYWACEPQLLSPRATTTEACMPHYWSPHT